MRRTASFSRLALLGFILGGCASSHRAGWTGPPVEELQRRLHRNPEIMTITVVDQDGPLPGVFVSADDRGRRWIPTRLDGSVVIVGTRLRVVRVRSLGYHERRHRLRSSTADSIVVRMADSDIETSD